MKSCLHVMIFNKDYLLFRYPKLIEALLMIKLQLLGDALQQKPHPV